jgi:low temperature requirement protein LtrA
MGVRRVNCPDRSCRRNHDNVHVLSARAARHVRTRSNEHDRAATPLELLFDLTFVAAFGIAGTELAHGVAVGHGASAAVGFCISMVAIVWAWVNYSWFASGFDNDDWLFRLLTMVQMAGVIVLAIGLPSLFAALEQGGVPTDYVMVAGYVVMRVAVIAQWLRVARGNPEYRPWRRPTCSSSARRRPDGWCCSSYR